MDFLKRQKRSTEANAIDDGGYYDSYDAGDDMGFADPAVDTDRTAAKRAPSFSSSVNNNSTVTMMLMKPSTYEEGRNIADQLMKNNAVIMNLEYADGETASNLLYFLTGVLYAIDGHMKSVSSGTYMLTPNHMQVADENDSGNGAGDNGGDTGYGAGFGGVYGGGYGN